MAKTKIEDVDLYAILDLTISASESEIKKAYRKKALQCHPDKNPDDPKAAEAFHELSRALEILTDAAARSAYDKVLRAKAAAKLRHQELDSKRQKLKEDLERREREAMSGSGMSNLTDEQKKFNDRYLNKTSKRILSRILAINLLPTIQKLYCLTRDHENCVFFDNRVEHIKFVDFCGKYRIPLLQYLCSSKCITGSWESREVDSNPHPHMMRKVLLG